LQRGASASSLPAEGEAITRREAFRRPAPIAATVVALLAVAALAASLAWAASPKTKRVSVKSNGQEVNNDNDFPAVSGSGRFVTFESTGKFTKRDDGADADVFVHDRRTGKTKRVSVKSNGNEVPGANSADSSISADGRFVAFASDGALTRGDGNGMVDIYVHDRRSGKTKRVSVKSNGKGVPADSENPAISANGRHVAYESDGAFTSGDSNGMLDVWEHALKSGKTRRVSVKSNGQGVSVDSQNAAISGDGRFVAFDSFGEFTSPDFGFMVDYDVFVHDRKTGNTTRMSLKSNGDEVSNSSNVGSRMPAISADGTVVAFSADASGTFVGSDTNGFADVYVHNRRSGQTRLVSVKSNEEGGNNTSGVDAPATISANGRFVAFESYARLVGSDNNDPFRDIYLRDRKQGKTKRVSVKSNGDEVAGFNHQLPAISLDGRFVAFSSFGKFTGSDAGSDFDVFERGPLR
jgi:tricorn protease-like protein